MNRSKFIEAHMAFVLKQVTYPAAIIVWCLCVLVSSIIRIGGQVQLGLIITGSDQIAGRGATAMFDSLSTLWWQIICIGKNR